VAGLRCVGAGWGDKLCPEPRISSGRQILAAVPALDFIGMPLSPLTSAGGAPGWA